mgnify:CR=1 FL=1
MIEPDSVNERVLELPIFATLGESERMALLAHCTIEHVPAGEQLRASGKLSGDYIAVLSGELEVVRISDEAGAGRGVEARRNGMARNLREGDVLHVDMQKKVAAVIDTDFVRIDGDLMDDALATALQFADLSDELRARASTARNARSLRSLPMHQFAEVYRRFESRPVEAGEIIVTQGEKGENYYLIESRRAEVWRSDPVTDEISLAATLGPGDAFGEEAVILDGFRNATVKMITSGKLLVLDQKVFTSVLRANHVTEVDAEEARRRIAADEAQWLDCRYEMEYDEARIAGSRLVELDTIRDACAILDKSRSYIVYCRSGRRSACAAFLLRERGIDAVSLRGGLRDWPFAVESSL